MRMNPSVKRIVLGNDSGIGLRMPVSTETDAQDAEELVDTRIDNIQALFKERSKCAVIYFRKTFTCMDPKPSANRTHSAST